MKALNFARYAFITAAVGLFATSSDAAWTYTETNTVANGVSHGYLTDNVWTFYASRAKNSTDELTVDALKGMSINPAQPAKIDFSEIENGYKVVKFVGVRNTQSPLVLYTTEFIAPDCVNLSGQEIFYRGTENNKPIYNTTLTKIQLREDVAVTLGNDRMFCNCTYLTSFTPKKIANKTLNTDMFSGCSALEGEFEFSECTQFNGGVFNGCSQIGGIKAEKAVIIEQSAFRNCSNLSNIVLSAAVEKISNYAFAGCSQITTEFVQGLLHKGLKQLGNSATDRKGCFQNCTGLTGSLVWNLPNLITNAVPNDCFSDCTSLERVEIKSKNLVDIGSGAFQGINAGGEVVMPKNVIKGSFGARVVWPNNTAAYSVPYPKIRLTGDVDAWLEKIKVNHYMIKKADFENIGWDQTSISGVTKPTYSALLTAMGKDTTMCEITQDAGKSKVRVLDNQVVAFIYRQTGSERMNGCWILKKPETGFKVIVR